jgi:hypothetical protein
LKKEKIASASLFHSEKKTLTVPSLHWLLREWK